jgi:transcriptional regulator with XRE-family HTH domain
MDEVHQRIAGRIRELAAKRNIALTYLPDRAGVARSYYWSVLAGHASPTIRWLERIAAVLEVDVEDLLKRPRRG